MKQVLYAFLLFGAICPVIVSAQTTPPTPYGAVPTEHQVNWQKLENYMFMHFGPNTFTDVEWGDGQEDPNVFNPTDLDCRQWAATAKAAGMKGIIITAKHHDGFCLWPSEYSTHTVRESAWRDGKGDVLKELSEACEEYGLKFGVYLSPWDQNHPSYGTPQYNQIFANTLNEVLSCYGEIFEQWFDGAKGTNGKNQVYDFDLFIETVYRNQPQAIIFSDIGPGCRWMGNESAVMGETNWSTLNVTGYGRGSEAPSTSVLNTGNKNGEAWVPAEADVSIRPGWFYSPSTDNQVKTVDKLMDIYYTSVGRNANLLLNVPPDRRGRIHGIDSTRLIEFRQARDAVFSVNLINGATIQASHTRGNLPVYAAANILDEDYDTYWATNDNELTPSIEIDLKEKKTFNRLLLQEYIPLGQRVSSFNVQYLDEQSGNWEDLTKATTIGYKRILLFPATTTQKLKITFEAMACPLINAMGLYLDPREKPIPVQFSSADTSDEHYYLMQFKRRVDAKDNVALTNMGLNQLIKQTTQDFADETQWWKFVGTASNFKIVSKDGHEIKWMQRAGNDGEKNDTYLTTTTSGTGDKLIFNQNSSGEWEIGIKALVGTTSRAYFNDYAGTVDSQQRKCVGLYSGGDGGAHLYFLNASDPAIYPSVNAVSFGPWIEGLTVSQAVSVTGARLEGSITCSITGPDKDYFSVTSASLPATGGDLTIRFTPDAARAYVATLELMNGALEPVSLPLTGSGNFPYKFSNANENYWYEIQFVRTIKRGGKDANRAISFVQKNGYIKQDTVLTGSFNTRLWKLVGRPDSCRLVNFVEDAEMRYANDAVNRDRYIAVNRNQGDVFKFEMYLNSETQYWLLNKRTNRSINDGGTPTDGVTVWWRLCQWNGNTDGDELKFSEADPDYTFIDNPVIDIDKGEKIDTHYYNLQGIRLERAPQTGIYIQQDIYTGGKITRKVVTTK